MGNKNFIFRQKKPLHTNTQVQQHQVFKTETDEMKQLWDILNLKLSY